MGWFSSSSRTQGTVTTPRPFPVGMLLAAIVVALAAWGLGAFFLAAHRHALVAAQADAAPAARAPALVPFEHGQATPQLPTQIQQPPPAPEPPQSPEAEDAAMAVDEDACSHAIADAGIRLPADFRVLAAGGYRGRDLGFSLGRNGNRASQFDVIVNSPGKPVALMLGAYDPTIWNLSSTPGTRIVAVYVGGYEPQSLAASPGDVPVLVSSYEQHTPCPYFYLGGEGRPTIDAAASRVFGRPVEQVYSGGEDGSIFVGPGGPLVR